MSCVASLESPRRFGEIMTKCLLRLELGAVYGSTRLASIDRLMKL